MKLPVKQTLSRNKKHYQIVDREHNIVVTDVPLLEDGIYIEEALNNYQKAIELLKATKQYLEWREDFIVEDHENGERNGFTKIVEFLKSIEQ